MYGRVHPLSPISLPLLSYLHGDIHGMTMDYIELAIEAKSRIVKECTL